jgi:hypothetical protein
MKLSIAEIERRFSAQANHSLPDFTVRDAHLGKAGLLSRGGRGPNAPRATGRDFEVMTLGLICSWQAKDVVKGYKRLRKFALINAYEEKDGIMSRMEEPPFPLKAALKDVLLSCLHQCTVHPEFRLLNLRVDLSEVEPQAALSIGWYVGGIRKGLCQLSFAGPLPPAGAQPEAREYSMRLREHALMTMVDLLATNIQAQDDTGPSARTDEPGHPILMKNPWAALPCRPWIATGRQPRNATT